MPNVPCSLDIESALMFQMEDDSSVTRKLVAPLTFEVLDEGRRRIGFTDLVLHSEEAGLWMLREHIDPNAVGGQAVDPYRRRLYRLVEHAAGYIPFPYRSLSNSPGPCTSREGELPYAVAHSGSDWALLYASGDRRPRIENESPVPKRSRRFEAFGQPLYAARPPAFMPPASVCAHNEMKICARFSPPPPRKAAADVTNQHTLC